MAASPPIISRSVSEATSVSMSTAASQLFTPSISLDGSVLTTPGGSALGARFSEGVDKDVIPWINTRQPRTLVLCFDGTGDQFDTDNSNVVLFCSMLLKDCPAEQLVYYQAGIGTYTIPQIATPLLSNASRLMDEMFGWSLDAHVMGGYEFLMTNYQRGDKICLFGFSRGAYTARALAGMVHKVGLIPRSNHQQVPFAYRMFTRADKVGWDQSKAFKKAFSMDVDIDFIGVWDTVCSVGLFPRTLPFTSSNTAIRTFRHALSLDEHRAKFKANHYNRPSHKEAACGVQPGEMPKSSVKKRFGQKKDPTEYETEFSAEDEHNSPTDVLEVWFAGCHCDVGGGSVENGDKRNLARIPLRWMIRECFKAKTGIRFHADLLKTVGLDPNALYPEVKPRPEAVYEPSSTAHQRGPTDATLVDASVPSTEEQEDCDDAVCPIYDELKLARYWWILEVIPLLQPVQKALNKIYRFTINWGRGRKVPLSEPFNVHRSVKIRQDYQHLPGGRYKPNAIIAESLDPVWVD